MLLIFEDAFYDFEPYQRCPLECIFLHRLENSELTLAASNLISIAFQGLSQAFEGLCQVSFSCMISSKMLSIVHHFYQASHVILSPVVGVRQASFSSTGSLKWKDW